MSVSTFPLLPLTIKHVPAHHTNDNLSTGNQTQPSFPTHFRGCQYRSPSFTANPLFITYWNWQTSEYRGWARAGLDWSLGVSSIICEHAYEERGDVSAIQFWFSLLTRVIELWVQGMGTCGTRLVLDCLVDCSWASSCLIAYEILSGLEKGR